MTTKKVESFQKSRRHLNIFYHYTYSMQQKIDEILINTVDKYNSMSTSTLKEMQKDISKMKKELQSVKELVLESTLDLQDNVTRQVHQSRQRKKQEFKTQEEIEKRFL